MWYLPEFEKTLAINGGGQKVQSCLRWEQAELRAQ